VIHVFDLKGMQVALARGGGASLVALFCTVCDCTKDVRATLLEGETPVDPAEIRTRVQHFQRESDIPELEEALKSYKPERHQTNASVINGFPSPPFFFENIQEFFVKM